MEKIIIGKIVNAVGLKGEVKVYNYADGTDIYECTPQIYVGDSLMTVANVRTQKNMVILKLEEIQDRDGAEKAKGTMLYVTEEDLPELPEGQFYIRDIIGMTAVLEDGSVLGTVTDVIQNTAQDIFEIETEEKKKILVPKVDEFILNIDKADRTVTVRLIPGMAG